MKALNALKGHVPLMLVRTLSDCMSTTALAWSQNPGPLEWVRPPSSLIPSPNEHVFLCVLPPSPVYNSQKKYKSTSPPLDRATPCQERPSLVWSPQLGPLRPQPAALC